MSAPKGAASLSVLQLPSPNVVRGDTMRDSLGVAAPLSVVAYDGNDAKISDIKPLFFISDTSHTAHLKDGAVLVGDRLGFVQLIGQVGGLQTPPVSVPVTVAPTTFARVLNTDPTKGDTLFAPPSTDSAASIGRVALAVSLRGVGDTASQGFVVRYKLLQDPAPPATKPGATTPAVYLATDPAHIASIDTTDATGATLLLVVNAFYLANQKPLDSAVVEVSTSYKGVPVAGSPIRIVVPIKVTFTVK
ncbi:MAG: hypothetical protein ABJF01_15290 [bacterium]